MPVIALLDLQLKPDSLAAGMGMIHQNLVGTVLAAPPGLAVFTPADRG